MKENVIVLATLVLLVLPWFDKDREGGNRREAVWDGTGMPPDERFADWS